MTNPAMLFVDLLATWLGIGSDRKKLYLGPKFSFKRIHTAPIFFMKHLLLLLQIYPIPYPTNGSIFISPAVVKEYKSFSWDFFAKSKNLRETRLSPSRRMG